MIEKLAELSPLVFYGGAIFFALAELVAPRRPAAAPCGRRWVTNIGLFLFGMLVQRVCVPLSMLAIAEVGQRSGLGLFNAAGATTGWAAAVVGVAALDLWKYGEHRLSHSVPLLWRLHMTHHSDVDTDFTTTERQHPLDVLLASASFVFAIFLLGISPLAVAIYLLLTSADSLFSHANIRLPRALERLLSVVVVTPGVHHVHHSSARRETDSNYGSLLTVWDRLFDTYRPPDSATEAARIIGLEYFRDGESARLDRVLCQPFLKPTATPRALDEPHAEAR
jgi:sterol desaturase/sphingolipid hydroxylase (fatty acid hydroxylase superfamily)